MSEAIERTLYLFAPQRMAPVRLVENSLVPIEMTLADYTVPSGAVVKAYARGENSGTTYVATCTVTGNVVRLTPPAMFFVPGNNYLQIEINGTLIPLALLVQCQEQLSNLQDDTSTPETVKPLVIQAQEILAECKQVAVKTPYVGDNENWYVWDTATNAFKDSGVSSRGLKGDKGDKGNKGDPGAAATVTGSATVFQASASGTAVPTGTWSTTPPAVTAGQYLWTRTTINFNSGDPVVTYSVARWGMDGSGAVSSVNGVSPDDTGNVTITGDSLTVDGKTISAALAGKQDSITATGILKRTASGIVAAVAGTDYQAPIGDGGIATAKLADGAVSNAKIANGAVSEGKLATSAVTAAKISDGAVTAAKLASAVKTVAATATLAAANWSDNQITVNVAGVTASNNVIVSPAEVSRAAWLEANIRCTAQGAGTLTFKADTAPTDSITVNVLIINI